MKLALFSSVGYSTNCINHYLYKMKDNCDLFVNYYLESESEYYKNLIPYTKFHSNIYTTKFPALKNCFLNSDIGSYDYIFILDDDCIVEFGDLLEAPSIMQKYSIDIASGCHSINGRTSYKIMHQHHGNHIFRYTNFVEMNFPIFSQNALHKYMSIYDGELCGWGNDWWYLHTMDCNRQKNCAIIDKVCIKNPDHHEKQYQTIEKFMLRDDRRKQWEQIRHKYQLHEWKIDNIDFVYE